MLATLRSWMTRGAQTAARPNAVRTDLDRLDDRLVPTVVFRPALPGTALVSGTGHNALSSPPVELIFSGSYWNTAAGSSEQAALLRATQMIVGSPYLSALSQYGGDGKAVYDATWTDAVGLPNKFTDDQLMGAVHRAVDAKGSPVLHPAASSRPPLYVVVTPPGQVSAESGAAGYNKPLDYVWQSQVRKPLRPTKPGIDFPVDPDPVYVTNHATAHVIWVNPSGGDGTGKTSLDQFSGVLSHELVEAISDAGDGGAVTTVPDAVPGWKSGQLGQVGDGEPDARRYGYFVNGYRVQPYWSERDKAFVVPDGNRQNFYLDPVWSAGAFTGRYDLTLTGDQLGAGYNDAISTTVSMNDSQGTGAAMNGESVNFKKGVIRNITVNAAGGSNAVNLNVVEAGTAVNVTNSTGGSFDTVNVGGGYLSNIQGSVNVSNSSGSTTLVVDDSKDTTARTAHVTTGAVTFDGLATVGYSPDTTLDHSGHGVKSVSVLTGTAADSVSVDSINPSTALFIDGQVWRPFIGRRNNPFAGVGG